MNIDFDTKFHMLLINLRDSIESMDPCVTDPEMTSGMIDQLTVLEAAYDQLKREFAESRESRGNL